MTPLEYYASQCTEGSITHDPAQEAVLQDLQSLHFHLIKEDKKRRSLLSYLRSPQLVSGMYIWGGVGVGKTFLMDCFYTTLPIKKKRRLHFYQFMQFIHQQLKLQQGKKNPLQTIANTVAKETMVLCFDELFVNDIADAMILGRLFEALFNRGVSLVVTSNVMPDDLYKNGLQRRQFLPAIALLKEKMQIVHLASDTDYRLQYLKSAGVFHMPLNKETTFALEKIFDTLTSGHTVDTNPIELNGRQIPVHKKSTDVIWFEFKVLCNVPRSQQDYLAIAQKYHIVFLSNIPIISPEAHNTIRLFISLVDVLYDAGIQLVFSAAAPIETLYTNGNLSFEFERTRSRLIEMQSQDYFTRHPL